MKFPLRDSFDPIDAEAIRQLEADLQMQLSDDYRYFLVCHNGGCFEDDVWYSEEDGALGGRIDEFFAVNADDRRCDIRRQAASFEDLLFPDEVLPIGHTTEGWLCLQVVGEPFGIVYWADRAQEFDEPWENVEPIASSFDAFLASLVLSPEWRPCETIPAFRAVEIGDGKWLRAALQEGLDPNARNEHGSTLLMTAANKCRPRIVETLLDAGADVHAHGSYGKTGLHITNSVDVLKLLLERGGDPNARDHMGRTPLFDAIGRLALRHVKLLIRTGADVNARDGTGKTPLRHCTVGFADTDIRPLLIQAGAIE